MNTTYRTPALLLALVLFLVPAAAAQGLSQAAPAPARAAEPARAADGAEALLGRARAALGEWEAPQVQLVGRGEALTSGVPGELTLVLGTEGRFLSAVESTLPQTGGFDGSTAWTRDRTGLERVVELEEADRLCLLHWVLSGYWTEAPEVEVTRGPEVDTLLLALEGSPMHMRLTLDPDTALPVRLEELGDDLANRWTLGDHRPVGGRLVPHRWTAEQGENEESFEIDSFDVVARDLAVFEQSFELPGDVRFDEDAETELVVERMRSGHLLVEPLVNGEFVGAFIFDTGAGITVIDKGVADELGLDPLGHTLAVGVAGSTTSEFRLGETFQLGPVTLLNPIYGDLDLSFLQPHFGRKIAGIVGYDLLARCVVELEPATPRLALHDHRAYDLHGGAWQDLVLHQNHPCARARFEGEREGLFRLDTGAGGTVTFHAPAVTRLGLLEGRDVTPGMSGGVGGSASAPEGALAWFELAGHRFEDPRVAFSQAASGAFTDPYTDGNIGQDFLSPFRIVLDYRNDRIAFLPLGS